MESALDLKKLNCKVSNKYDYDERRIVGIMLARYDLPLTQSIVDSCYLYWHYNTSEALDFFWAGYGEYLCADEQTSNKIILKFDGNDTRVYYDREAFISIKNEFNQIFKKPYQDKLQLVLVNYYEGKLRFDEAIKIDLEENIDFNFSTIRELVEYITNECGEVYDVTELARKLKSERIKDYVKNNIKGITISDVIGTALGISGL